MSDPTNAAVATEAALTTELPGETPAATPSEAAPVAAAPTEAVPESSAATAEPPTDPETLLAEAAALGQAPTPENASPAPADQTADPLAALVAPAADATAPPAVTETRRAARTYVGLQRVGGTIKVVGGTQPSIAMQCRILLSDISETGLGCFSEKALCKEQEVDLHIELPDGTLRFPARGIWCREQPSSGRVVSVHQFRFRVGVQFVFETPEQKNSLQELLGQIKKSPGATTKR